MAIVQGGVATEIPLGRAAALRDAGAEWLAAYAVPLLDTDAALRRLYRLPYALAVSGRVDEAQAAMALLGEKVLTGSGDLAECSLRTRFSHRWASYPLAILAMGASSAGQAGVARRIVAKIRADFIDPDGGALGERPEVRSTRRQDLFTTAQVGISARLLGDSSLARAATRWVERLWMMQPHAPHVVYLSTDSGGLIMDDDVDRPGEAGSVLRMTAERQPYASPGIAAAFLADEFRHTRRSHALQTAREYFDLYRTVHPSAYRWAMTVQVCKRIWGAAALLRATGEAAYLDDVSEMVDWFGESANNDGSWSSPSHLLHPDEINAPLPAQAEITAEFVQHLAVAMDSISSHRAAGDDPRRPARRQS